jgi:geranylgeranyl reductase family protein
VIQHIIVVGAGPAGIAAAITLRTRGYDVTVIDKAVFPRDKCCGDGLTTGALRLLDQLGFDPSTVADWNVCTDVIISSPEKNIVTMSLPHDRGQFAAIAPRMQLDAALVQLARSRGVTVLEGVSFRNVISTSTSQSMAEIEIEVDGHSEPTMTGDYLIAADGMWSPVRRSVKANMSSYLGEWHAFRQYFSGVTGPASSQLFVWFEPDLLPGYAWSFPLPNGRVNVGFGVLRTDDTSVQFMKHTWDDLWTRPHIVSALGPHAVPEGRHTAWPIPARVTDAAHSSGRVLFVGDAICAADTLTGEGIGQALLTGLLAAQAISEGNQASDVRARYTQLLRQEFYADHRMSTLLGKALARRRLAELALRIVNLNNWTRRNFVRWMFEDEPRASLVTPRRWHRKYLSRDGSFTQQLP